MTASALEYDEQVRSRHEQVGLSFEYPSTQGTWMCKVERLGEREAELTQRVPCERGDPGTEGDGTSAESWSVGPPAFWVAARNGIERHVVDANPVALLVMLPRPELMEQVETIGGVVMEDQ